MAAGSGSVLANAAQRRRGLNSVREALLDKPGISRRGGPPPPTVPAQDRTSPREEVLAANEVPVEQVPPESTLEAEGREQPGPTQSEQPVNSLGLDEETRKEFLAQIEPFLVQAKMEKKVMLHRKIGRSRRFFGGGI